MSAKNELLKMIDERYHKFSKGQKKLADFIREDYDKAAFLTAAMMRFYQFKVNEIVDDTYPDLDLEIDPKLSWALRHPEQFPVDINKADYEMILRIPGIGVKSAKLIIASRRYSKLGYYQLKKIGVVMKKAQYFITCSELPMRTVNEMTPQTVRSLLLPKSAKKKTDENQLSFVFND